MSEPSRQRQLESILHAHLQAVDAGQVPDGAELLRRHPEFADELREFLADQQKLNRFVESMHKVQVGAATIGAEDDADEMVGRIRYFGDYELLAEIARGGMGVVYKARQVSLNRIVALKMILAGQFASPALVQRFHTEAEAAANLEHPHIVPIYEVGAHEGRHYFSMKLIVQAAKSERDLKDQRRAARLIAIVSRAVHYAHRRGIIHRDLKPANILVDEQGQPHITDFGLAKRTEGDANLSQSGAIVGTPAYMAPEQAAGKKGLTTAADVYSLGAILYEWLTGRPPFVGATPMDILLQVMDSEATPPRQQQPGVARDVETICLKCLAKDPEKRYGTAEALAEDLERFLAGEPILARPAGVWTRTVKWARRRPAAAALVSVTVCAAAALLVGGLVFNAELQLALRQVQAREIDLDAANGRIAAREVDLHKANTQVQEQLTQAQGLRMIAHAEVARPNNPGLALLLAVEGAARACVLQWPSFDKNAYTAGAFSPDGNKVVLAAAYRSPHTWDLTGAPIGPFTPASGSSPQEVSVEVGPHDLVVYAGGDRTARLFLNNREVSVLRGHTDAVHTAAFSQWGATRRRARRARGTLPSPNHGGSAHGQ